MRWDVEKPSYSLNAWQMLELGAAGAAFGWHTVEGADCAGLYALGRMSALEGSSGAQLAFMRRFGRDRVFNTPLSEQVAACAGCMWHADSRQCLMLVPPTALQPNGFVPCMCTPVNATTRLPCRALWDLVLGRQQWVAHQWQRSSSQTTYSRPLIRLSTRQPSTATGAGETSTVAP